MNSEILTFKHKPKLGDIIYSLPLIKYLGGGILYLDPESEFFKGQKGQWIEKYNWLIPLIKTQSYIHDVKIYEGEDFAIDLDKYMNTTHLQKGDKVNIVDNHFVGQGMKPLGYEPWLNAKRIKSSKIIVANSSNYHDDIDYYKLLKGKLFGFVGTDQEAYDFRQRCKIEFTHFGVTDSRMLAELINGCEIFIGNQSLPLSIALGLGKKCWVEQSKIYPNCIMGKYRKL